MYEDTLLQHHRVTCTQKYFRAVTGPISVLIRSGASARADRNVTGPLRISDTGIELIIVYITESVTSNVATLLLH